ncbi:hypothetical protein DVB69_14720 [Sporosarcina sp. BI001-red]|uniref:hypothetical protein n=1 Tax=Sporosarcina sp. BI001-red TaxID=2282866 RepID=UPI000E244B3C|nr:hypothetical protein [Sporosarcina sp. BI001-red]REB05523.1 hypothetical protein DVB69_14720 [Sporosarcina sp. BI001-red]
MPILLTIGAFLLMLFGFNKLMGYRKGNITLDLDERYTSSTEQAIAVTEELQKQGKTAEYKGKGHFLVDGLPYIVHKRNVSMRGIPLERTVLVPENK